MQVLLIANDNLIQIVGLQEVASGAYINTATVTATLKDLAGANVSGASNLPCSYVAGSNGEYNGQIEDSVSLSDGAEYFCHIDAALGSLKGHWEVPCRAQVRRSR